MKWYYGVTTLTKSVGNRVTNWSLACLHRASTKDEAVGIIVTTEKVKELMKDGFKFSGEPAHAVEITDSEVRQMAADYGIVNPDIEKRAAEVDPVILGRVLRIMEHMQADPAWLDELEHQYRIPTEGGGK